MKFVILILACTGLMTAQDRDAGFRQLADRYFDEVYFRFNPSSGTSSGFHQYDSRMEDYSASGIRAQIEALKRFRSEVEQFHRTGLSEEAASDYDILLGNIRGSLLTLERIRPWEKNPDFYSGNATASIFVIMSRKFAPADERLRAVVAREREIPAMFQAARANLRNPPHIYTEIALEQLPGIISFFEKDVPAAFPGALTDAFRSSNAAVLDALRAYGKFLKDDLLPQSNGDFRIGAELYREKLLDDEMVDTPLEKLLEIGYADLRRNQAEFRKVAAAIDPKRSPEQILQEAEQDHPAPGALLDTFRGVLGGLVDFIQTRHIITIPSDVRPILQETPPFMRALTFASMDTPGPYEKVAKEAFFNVTLPEANWSRERISQHMAAFNRGTIISTAIHEAYPGHYVQFLWVPQAPSKVRRLLGAGTNVEGWAHYCEQMMLDEGYRAGDHKLRLGQIQDALLRDARYIAGIRMHTGDMTMEQAIEFFVTEGHQVRPTAEKEAKRGTSDPTYLVYTLGKLEILKLREDYKAMKGGKYTLQGFHDAFLQQGNPPVKIVRKALLGNDSPVL